MPTPITASSAIDVQGMVASLMNVERKPLTLMQTEAKKIDTKISAYGKLQSAVSTFRDASAALARLETWRAYKATSATPAAIEATAGTGAAGGQHQVFVTTLAAGQSTWSGGFAAADTVIGGGTLRLQLGTQPGGATSFTPSATSPEVAVSIPANSTLADVRDAINAADAGVRASIARDGDTVRLVLSSATTGAAQAFRMLATDGDGTDTDTAGLSALAFDPTAAAGAGRNQSLATSARDAIYGIDGMTLTSPTNRIAGALSGVDLVLKQTVAEADAVPIDVTVDTEKLQEATKKFVDAYNALNTLLAEQTKYDEATKSAGALQGDRSAVGILGQIRSIVRETVTGGTLTKLADVGITLQRNGSLSLNAETFKSAATDPKRLEVLFAGTGGGVGSTDRGLMLRFRDLGDSLIGTTGSVTTATESWQKRLNANKARQEALETRLTDVEKRLLRQYTALDTQLAQAQATSASLNSALAGLPGSR